MTDRDAIAAMVAAHPDDDLPVLVLADYLDEHGSPELARVYRTLVAEGIAGRPILSRATPFAIHTAHRIRDAIVRRVGAGLGRFPAGRAAEIRDRLAAIVAARDEAGWWNRHEYYPRFLGCPELCLSYHERRRLGGRG